MNYLGTQLFKKIFAGFCSLSLWSTEYLQVETKNRMKIHQVTPPYQRLPLLTVVHLRYILFVFVHLPLEKWRKMLVCAPEISAKAATRSADWNPYLDCHAGLCDGLMSMLYIYNASDISKKNVFSQHRPASRLSPHPITYPYGLMSC